MMWNGAKFLRIRRVRKTVFAEMTHRGHILARSDDVSTLLVQEKDYDLGWKICQHCFPKDVLLLAC